MELTIKDYIDGDFTFAFLVNRMQRYEGILYSKYGNVFLTEKNLEDLKQFENIYNLLNNSLKLIKITKIDNEYLLQELELHYEGPYNEKKYYMLENFITSSNLLDLLKEYDNIIKEENNVKTK